MNVLSLCHSSAPSPFGDTWSSTTSSGSVPYFGANGGTLTGPIWRANASCCSGVMSWPRKNTTPCASNASSIASTSECDNGRRKQVSARAQERGEYALLQRDARARESDATAASVVGIGRAAHEAARLE